MSVPAERNLAQLRIAEEQPNIDVDDQALRNATIKGLREYADEIDEFRTNALEPVDGPLADTSAYLRALADALEDGANSEHAIRAEANFSNSKGGHGS